jgi:hypothetical protein
MTLKFTDFLRITFLFGALIAFNPLSASAETIVSGAGGGAFPPETSFNGVPINALEFGYGLQIEDSGGAIGQFCTVLLGAAVGDIRPRIIIDGVVSSGSRTAANAATYSGIVTINMGDGTPPAAGVPFTATIVTDGNDQGTLGLVIGETTLPTAGVNEGSQTVK